jgi:hypothetical protein
MGGKVPHQGEVRLQLFEEGFPEITPSLSFDLEALDRPFSKGGEVICRNSINCFAFSFFGKGKLRKN